MMKDQVLPVVIQRTPVAPEREQVISLPARSGEMSAVRPARCPRFLRYISRRICMSAFHLKRIRFVFGFLAGLGAACAQPYAYVSSVAGNNVTVVNTATASVVTSVR